MKALQLAQFRGRVSRLAALVAVGVMPLAQLAHAAIDTTDAEAEIAAAAGAVATIGLAVFAVVIAIKVWKWLRAST